MASLQYSNFMDSVNVLGNSDPRAKRVVVIGNKIKNVAIKFLKLFQNKNYSINLINLFVIFIWLYSI